MYVHRIKGNIEFFPRERTQVQFRPKICISPSSPSMFAPKLEWMDCTIFHSYCTLSPDTRRKQGGVMKLLPFIPFYHIWLVVYTIKACIRLGWARFSEKITHFSETFCIILVLYIINNCDSKCFSIYSTSSLSPSLCRSVGHTLKSLKVSTIKYWRIVLINRIRIRIFADSLSSGN